jgi:hypothetical protein
MVSSIATDKEDLAAFRLTGALDKKDYDFLIPIVEEKLSRFGKINLYWEMVASEGWNLEGLWEDLKFDLTHLNSFRKVAIVGDKKWEEWIATISKPFTSAEVKYFYEPQREEALAWVSR